MIIAPCDSVTGSHAVIITKSYEVCKHCHITYLIYFQIWRWQWSFWRKVRNFWTGEFDSIDLFWTNLILHTLKWNNIFLLYNLDRWSGTHLWRVYKLCPEMLSRLKVTFRCSNVCYVAKVQVCSVQWLATCCHWNDVRCASWGHFSNSCSYLWTNDQHFNFAGMSLSFQAWDKNLVVSWQQNKLG
jgi:hypothetical protein